MQDSKKETALNQGTTFGYFVIAFAVLFSSVFDVPAFSGQPAPEACLGKTMECEWPEIPSGALLRQGPRSADDSEGGHAAICRTDPLVSLAAELGRNPVNIYKWVYENIAHEDYTRSRKGARSTYRTRKGNDWDQCSLLIALFRICGIPARYVRNAREHYTYAEAYLPVVDSQNTGKGEEKQWVPLFPWKKVYEFENGIDLFKNGEIPDDLRFDFDAYLSKIRQKTALEVFEEQVQNYLTRHHPGRSLKDVPFKRHIVRYDATTLPGRFPTGLEPDENNLIFAEPPESYRVYVDLFFKADDPDHAITLLEKRVYLPEVSGKRLCLDWVPASPHDAAVIRASGGICRTPANAARIKPLLRLDGKTYSSAGIPIFIGTRFSAGIQKMIGSYTTRIQGQAGSLLQIGLDSLSACRQTIQQNLEALEKLPASLAYDDATKEKYLGRVGHVLMTTFLLRQQQALERANELLYTRRSFTSTSISHTWILTFPKEIKISTESKFLIHPPWRMDMCIARGTLYKQGSNTLQKFKNDSVFAQFAKNLVMYDGSFNEGLIFEDWQDTPGTNTIKSFMIANEQGIDIRTLTSKDIESVGGKDHIRILENQKEDRLLNRTIQAIINQLKEGDPGEVTIIAPVKRIRYKGMIFHAFRKIGIRGFQSYMFCGDNGGITSGEIEKQPKPDDANAEPFLDGKGVNLATGELFLEERPDFLIRSSGLDLSLKRIYRSKMDYRGPFGNGWAWNHMNFIKVSGHNLTYRDSLGTTFDIIDNLDGTYSYPAGNTFLLTKGSNHDFTITDKTGMKFYFNSAGYLTVKEDAVGNSLTFTYNGMNQLIKITDPFGRELNFRYKNGKITVVEDSAQRRCFYAYSHDDLVSFTDTGGITTRYEYLIHQENDANNHNMSKYILPAGDPMEIGYYKNDQVAYQKDYKGGVFSFQYSRLNRYAETWNEEGSYRKVFFNEKNDVARIRNHDKTIVLNKYDSNHNRIEHTDANGKTTRYQYDSKRNLLSHTCGP